MKNNINDLEVVQGDTSETYKFQRKDANDNVITTNPKKMWITFKEAPIENAKVLFQKTLENGITYSEEDNYYRFQLESTDTESLPYGEYGFDIAIINEANKKKTLKRNGVLTILDHYTHKKNEV